MAAHKEMYQSMSARHVLHRTDYISMEMTVKSQTTSWSKHGIPSKTFPVRCLDQ